MPRFNISYNFFYEVEAEDECEAMERAYEYFCDKGYREIVSIEKVGGSDESTGE